MIGRRQLEAIESRTSSDAFTTVPPSAAATGATSGDHAAPARTAAFVVSLAAAAATTAVTGSGPPMTSLSGWLTYEAVVALRSWTTAAASNLKPTFRSGV